VIVKGYAQFADAVNERVVGDHRAPPHAADQVVAAEQPTGMPQKGTQKRFCLRAQHADRAVGIAAQFASMPIEREAIEAPGSDRRIDLAGCLAPKRAGDRRSFPAISAIHRPGNASWRDAGFTLSVIQARSMGSSITPVAMPLSQ